MLAEAKVGWGGGGWEGWNFSEKLSPKIGSIGGGTGRALVRRQTNVQRVWTWTGQKLKKNSSEKKINLACPSISEWNWIGP
jgi:hypothetical protein